MSSKPGNYRERRLDSENTLLAAFRDALARSLDPEELLRALGVAIASLLRETAQVHELVELVAKVEPQLGELSHPWSSEPETPPEGGDG